MIASDAFDASRFQQAEGCIDIAQTVDQVTDAENAFDVHRLQGIDYTLQRFSLAVDVADHTQPAELAPLAHGPNLGAFARLAKNYATGAPGPRVVDPFPCSTCVM